MATMAPHPPAALLLRRPLPTSPTTKIASFTSLVAAGPKNRRRRRLAKPGTAVRRCISAAADALRLLPLHPPGLVPDYGGNGGRAGGGGSVFWRRFGWGGAGGSGRKKVLGIDAVFVSVAILLAFGRRPEEEDSAVRVCAWCSSFLAGGRRAWSRHWVVGLFCFVVLMAAAAAGFKVERSGRFDLERFSVLRPRKTKRAMWWRRLIRSREKTWRFCLILI